MAEVEEKKEEMEVEKPTEETPAAPAEEVEKADEEMKEPAVVEPEEPKEKEEDSPEDLSARYTGPIELSSVDATLNCLISEKNLVQSLPVDNHAFVAATRSNIGVTDGRYLYEVEVLESRGQQSEIRLGFSCAGASLFLGEAETLCFSSYGGYFVDGEKVQAYRGRRFAKGDVIALLLNRTETGNAKTVSLFQNGNRIGEPQPIPESFDGALFPHVSVKLGVINVNFTKNILKPLPFEVRPIGDISVDDVTTTAIKEVAESKIVVPIGFDSSEYVQNYIDAHVADHFVQVTPNSITKWQEHSGWSKYPLDFDSMRSLERMLALRKRNYVYSLGHNLLKADRELLAKRLPQSVKKTMVVCPSIISKFPLNTPFAKDATLPTSEEGFIVEHTEGEAKSKAALEHWQKRCKHQTMVTDLKPGEYFKENLTKYEKMRDATRAFVENKKKEIAEAEKKAAAAEAAKADGAEEKKEEPKVEPKKEEPKKEGEKEEEKVAPSSVDCMNFAEEDWMLADLRVELHLLCHAFREDVEDKDRVSFAAEHLLHYYKLYHEGKKMFSLPSFGAKSVAECVEIISDTVAVEDGMLVPKHDRAISFDYIMQQVEDARQNRIDRIGAGDEGANLKFKAQPKRQPKGNYKGQNYKGQSYTNKGMMKGQQKGQKPMGVTSTPLQRLPYSGGPMSGSSQQKGGPKGKGYQQYPSPSGPKGANYQMRPVPQHGAASNYKRPEQPGFQQPAAKRFR